MGTAPNGWQTPKTDWQAADAPGPSDFNRIEGNSSAMELGQRTIDPTQTPTGHVGTLRQLLDWIANRIKAITGETNWYDAPPTTLTATKSHIDAAAPHSGHATTTALTAHTSAAAPHSGHETPSGAQTKVDAHAAGTNVHGATSAATANRIMMRDSSGRAKVAAPSVADDIARLDTVSALKVTALMALMRNAAAMNGADGDVTISSNTNLPRRMMSYNNLAVNAGVTLLGNSPGVWVIGVKGTLTLNGTIKAVGVPGGHSDYEAGDGGAGGGVLIVIANRIVGTGTLSAAGENGHSVLAAATGIDNVRSGTPGSLFGLAVPGGGIAGGVCPSELRSGLVDAGIFGFAGVDFGSGGGGGGSSGRCSNSNTNIFSGAGGAGIGGNGGDGADGLPAGTGTGAGGGGGGGLVILCSLNPVPAIGLLAQGGNGGDGKSGIGQSPGGGGGGGGYVLIVAPSSSASVNVAGGAAGTSYSGSGGETAGGAGLSRFMTI